MMSNTEGNQVGKELRAVPSGLATRWPLVAVASYVSDASWDREPRERAGGDAALVKRGRDFSSQLL